MRYRIGSTAIALALMVGWPSAHARLDARQGAAAPDTEILGTVTLSHNVMADGKPLQAGTYRLRLTGEQAAPPAAGQTPGFERWVEFLRGATVVGREVVSIVPKNEIQDVAKDAPPRAGGSKVQLLQGNEYLRVWVNKGGTHYLIHLPTGLAASP